MACSTLTYWRGDGFNGGVHGVDVHSLLCVRVEVQQSRHQVLDEAQGLTRHTLNCFHVLGGESAHNGQVLLRVFLQLLQAPGQLRLLLPVLLIRIVLIKNTLSLETML
ncbi:hypothetical protein EYF80_039413 [Liparis tanakae]|uniref:Uncharacterized protein n=1 Tax=Liparis tanakae TaxID=230148 RepID=A0A4Z2GA40_9TELE|nr:hypothetical protein EYF80_039413 [Liparis tanakae]